VTTLEHPPYSPDQTSADFYLLPRLKSGLKERRFRIANDIIRNATEELKRLSRKSFREVPKTFIVTGRSVYMQKGTILKEIQLR
jgi:hypothetical protein